MITIFSIPKPITNSHIEIIQENAVKSWSKLLPKPQIILLGEGRGIKQLTKTYGALYISKVDTNEYGTPLLSNAFAKARKFAKYKTIMYSNADMIYGPSLIESIKLLPKSNFLAVGSRIDIDITHKISFNGQWWSKLKHEVKQRGVPHPPLGSDYFIYNQNSFRDIPPFAVGRIKWDNWMIYQARKTRMKVIDCSSSITAIHQNHDYSHQLKKGESYHLSPEAKHNEKLAKSVWRPYTLRDSNWAIIKHKLVKKRYSLADFLLLGKDVIYGITEKFKSIYG